MITVMTRPHYIFQSSLFSCDVLL